MDYEEIKKIFLTTRNVMTVTSKYNSENMVEGVMNDGELTDESIQYLICHYYLFELYKGKDNMYNPHFIEIIENNSHKKEVLCDWFRKDKIFAENVITDYFLLCAQDDEFITMYNFEKGDKRYEVVNNLISKYYYADISYITRSIRINNYNKLLKAFNIPVFFKNGLVKQKVKYTNSQMLSCILSDVYSYLKYEKIDNKITQILETKDVKEIKKMLLRDMEFSLEIINYYKALCITGYYPNFYEIYYTNEHQDENYEKRMIKLNPLYMVDKISVQPIKNKQ